RAKKLKVGTRILLPDGTPAEVVGHDEIHVHLTVEPSLSEEFFRTHGHVPLPPYIRREDAPEDEERYQTVYARTIGSIAAPTAGLHFTRDLLGQLESRGIQMEWVSLHVGLGTFLPVRCDDIENHEMHSEECEVSADTASRINTAIARGRPVIAVGTTSVRTLESAFDPTIGALREFRSATRLFSRPGYEFKVVSGIFTNFHTPESTLLMLVSAMGGQESVLAAYKEAVSRGYRFFSYGDAMLII
ncbi:MAG: tRNA preQ1(34) S-adenosylmethionine ribosyltransferase-isomerase QueA, partial [Spirochaetales bacterium]